jgi:hypothetical protein
MIRSKFLRSFVLVLTLAVGASGCGLKTGSEDARKTEAAIKSELGMEAHINFRTFTSAASGTHTIVVVTLSQPPSGDVRELKAKLTEIAGRTFRSKVDRVDVVF